MKNWGKEQFKQYMAQFQSCFEQLALKPFIGKDCGTIREGYRKMPVGAHIVFYRLKNDSGIEIIRILHSRMDFEARLASD